MVIFDWDGDCTSEDILWVSDPISSLEWESHVVTFTPTKPIKYFTFAAIPVDSPPSLWGHVNMDNISPLYQYVPTNPQDQYILCQGESLTLTINESAATYAWSTGETTQSIEVTEAGIYTVDVKPENVPFQIPYTFKVLQPQIPQPELGQDTSICLGDTLVLPQYFVPDSGFIASVWQRDDTAALQKIYESGTYHLSYQLNGCEKSDEVTIEVVDCNIELRMPNVFTPNGDGLNDEFGPISYRALGTFHLQIFDRWGKQVFEIDRPDGSWDGTRNGKPLSEGTYYWVADYTDLVGNTFRNKGVMNLFSTTLSL